MRARWGQPPAGQRYKGRAAGDTGRMQQGKVQRDMATMGKGCLQRGVLQCREHVPALLHAQGIRELGSKHPGQEGEC